MAERATFNLKDHLANIQKQGPTALQTTETVNLSKMTRDELLGLADAALTEAARKPETENENA